MSRAAASATPKAELTAATAPLALVGGDDDFAVQQRARQLWDSWCKAAGGMDHEILDASASNSGDALKALGRLREALQTLPFFGGPKLVWFQNCTFLGEDRTSASAAVTEDLAKLADELKSFRWDGVRLLISASKPDKRRTFFKTVEKLGVVEIFAALSADDRDWATKAESEALRVLRAAGRSIDEDALGELVTRTGPNLRLLAQECEKLVVFTTGRDRITGDDIEAVTVRQKTAQAFALSEALGERHLGRALRTLDEELWEIRAGVDKRKSEIGLLYGLISKVRNLILVREFMQAGHLRPTQNSQNLKAQIEAVPQEAIPADRKYNPLALHPFVLMKSLAQASNYSSDELVRAMEILLDANRRLVSSDADEARVLQQAIVGIIGMRPAPRAR